jgi:hypothetical protein
VKEDTLDSSTVKQKLIAILEEIQRTSELECPALTGDTRPTEALPNFDSKAWPVATTILAIELGIPLPNEVNIFCEDRTKTPRSIDETAEFVCQLISKSESGVAVA